MLGKAKTLTVTGQYTVVYGNLERDKINNRITAIKKRIGDPKTNYFDKQKLRERIAALNGSAPVIYAGGDTLFQSREEKRRIEYAVAYAQTIERYGVFRKKDLLTISSRSEAEEILAEAINKSINNEDISTWLLVLMIQKVCGLMVMWLTTGAVMVSTGYDREDLELIKNGVDVERLRG
jgi:chaperonin GroEL